MNMKPLHQLLIGLLLSLLLVCSGCEKLLPPVPPNPDPNPTPVVNASWVIVIEETAARTPQTAAVLGDLNYWRGLSSRGIRFRFYDDDSADAARLGYVAKVEGVKRPALLVVDKTGSVVKTTTLPATIAGVDALLK